jgi:hypothetical protein
MTSGFGVLEYWSFGVLEKAKPRIQFQLVLSLLHYSTMLSQENKTIDTYSWGGSRPGFSGLDSCYGQSLKPGYFMNCCRETTKMGVPPGNRRVLGPRRT